MVSLSHGSDISLKFMSTQISMKNITEPEPWIKNLRRFHICNYFREIFKFRDFMNNLRNFAKPVFARIFAKFK